MGSSSSAVVSPSSLCTSRAEVIAPAQKAFSQEGSVNRVNSILRKSRPQSMKKTHALAHRLLPRFAQRLWRNFRATDTHRTKRITFCPTVRHVEFTRELDGGGTIPGDGSLVTIGLGRLVRDNRSLPLEGERRSISIEERAWVPPQQRVQMLRASMGDVGFFRAWQGRCRREVLQIRRSRAQSKNEPEHRQLMPESWNEAQSRAKSLAKEVQEESALRKSSSSESLDGDDKQPLKVRNGPGATSKGKLGPQQDGEKVLKRKLMQDFLCTDWSSAPAQQRKRTRQAPGNGGITPVGGFGGA